MKLDVSPLVFHTNTIADRTLELFCGNEVYIRRKSSSVRMMHIKTQPGPTAKVATLAPPVGSWGFQSNIEANYLLNMPISHRLFHRENTKPYI